MNPLPRWFAPALLSTLALASSCDDDEATPMEDVTPYLGVFNVAGGNVDLTCGGTPLPIMQALSGTVIVSRATMAPLQMTFSDPTLMNCTLFMDVAGGVATVRMGNSCGIFNEFFNGTIMVTSGTLSVASATMANVAVAGTVSGLITGGLPLQGCQANVNAQLARSVADGGVADAGTDAL